MRLISEASQLPSQLPKFRTVDTETYDPFLKERGPGWYNPDVGGILGIACHTPANDDAFYIPIRHADSDCMDIDTAMRWAGDVLFQPDCTMLFANAEYDLGWFHRHGVKYNGFQIEDIQIREPLIDEHAFSFSLNTLARKYGVPQKNYEVLRQAAYDRGIPEKEMMTRLSELPADVVGRYAVDDVLATYGVFKEQTFEFERQELARIYSLETSLVPYMILMRMRGVRIDSRKCEEASRVFLLKEQEALNLIRDQTGITIDKLFSADQVSKVLDYLGLSYPRTPKTNKPKIDKEFLESMPDMPLLKALQDARKFNKARTTFTEGFFDEFLLRGRVHTNFNLLKSDEGGTISGRLSSDSPNMQQIPARDPEIGPLVRSCVIPEEDCVFVSGDYSQQEPRHMVSMAYALGIPSASILRDRFIADRDTDFHQENADLTGLPRKAAKVVGLGLAYGMGGGKLAKSLQLPYTVRMRGTVEQLIAGPEATAVLNKFHAGAPYIRSLSEICKQRAKSRGYIVTPMGRRIHFPFVNGEMWKVHKSMNALIQGMSADETKQALLMCAQAGYLPCLQVHDELNFSDVQDPASYAEIAQIMCEAYIGHVPSKVDIEVGPSWGECKGFDVSVTSRYTDKEGNLYAA